MASTTTVDNLIANQVQATELNAGNALFTGKARFVQPIYTSGIEGSRDINSVTVGDNISDTDYVIFSNGSNLYRVSYSALVSDIQERINSIPDSEGVAY